MGASVGVRGTRPDIGNNVFHNASLSTFPEIIGKSEV